MSTSLITTKKYTVQQMDTLEGIAARNDSTIGQLMKLNRMSSRLIFPGQTLLIPVVVETGDDDFDARKSPTSSSPVLAKRFPGHVEAISSVSSISGDSASDRHESEPVLLSDDDKEYMQKFLKIFVREFTETEGVVSGVLLVTPNCVMFDPDVSHPLVVENGSEKYAMVAPMESILSIALFKNAEVMMEGAHSPDEVYRTPEQEENPFPVADAINEEEAKECGSTNGQQETERSDSAGDEILQPSSTNKCSEDEVVKDLNSPSIAHDNKPRVFKTLSHGMSCINKASGTILQRAQSVGGSGAAMAAKLVTGVPKKFVLMSNSILGGSSDPNPVPLSLPGIQYAPGQQQSFATLSELMRKTAEARQCLDRPESKKQTSILPSVEELIPQQRSDAVCAQMPFFLHIILDQRTLSNRPPHDGYGQNDKSEFWFSLPKEMADPLYAFLVRLCPEKYGSDVQMESADDSRKRSFILLDRTDAQTFKRSSDSCHQLSAPVSSSSGTLSHEWEIVSLSEIRRRLSLRDLSDVAHHPLPAGCEESNLLEEDLIRKLIDVLPARAQGYPWVLVYSSDLHGFALSTMYRQMASLKEDFISPSLLVVRDTDNHTFGCVVSCRFHLSDHYYGSGECLLFTVYPKFQVFRWTGHNTYIVKGSVDSLAIGASNGVNGLWLDSDFYRGRTERCKTFANEPLTEKTEFLIAGIEAWCFRLQ